MTSLRVLVSPLIASVLSVSCAAQLIGDRAPWLQMLMYMPLWPLALTAVCWDGLSRGRALPVRWLLAGLGALALVYSIAMLWSPARAPEGSASQRVLRVLQWNTQWGWDGVDTLARALTQQQPDLILLSEAPPTRKLAPALPRGWQLASVENTPGSVYWYRLTVLSRSRVTLREEWELPTGRAALFETAEPALRVLMVDLQSQLVMPRSPSIVEVARIVASLDEHVDLVAGDFNAPANFRGFDALEELGYRRASLWSGQWRATWPSWLPLSPFDIDHVWVTPRLQVAGATFFRGDGTDHRGQLTQLRLQ